MTESLKDEFLAGLIFSQSARGFLQGEQESLSLQQEQAVVRAQDFQSLARAIHIPNAVRRYGYSFSTENNPHQFQLNQTPAGSYTVAASAKTENGETVQVVIVISRLEVSPLVESSRLWSVSGGLGLAGSWTPWPVFYLENATYDQWSTEEFFLEGSTAPGLTYVQFARTKTEDDSMTIEYYLDLQLANETIVDLVLEEQQEIVTLKSISINGTPWTQNRQGIIWHEVEPNPTAFSPLRKPYPQWGLTGSGDGTVIMQGQAPSPDLNQTQWTFRENPWGLQRQTGMLTATAYAIKARISPESVLTDQPEAQHVMLVLWLGLVLPLAGLIVLIAWGSLRVR